MKRRKLAILTAAVLLLAAVPLAADAETMGKGTAEYTDLKKTNWAYEAVAAMRGAGIVAGYPDGSFRPSRAVTYGEFIKMALIADTGTDPGNASGSSWARNYYNAALEAGYFTIYDIHISQLPNEIPRGDMALIASAVLGEAEIKKYDAIQQEIIDVDAETEHEYDIVKSYAAGVLTGYEDGSFRPEGTLTRAEAAAVVCRLTDGAAREIPVTQAERTGTVKSMVKNYRTYEMEAAEKYFLRDGYHGSWLDQYTEGGIEALSWCFQGIYLQPIFIDLGEGRTETTYGAVTSDIIDQSIKDGSRLVGEDCMQSYIDKYGREAAAAIFAYEAKNGFEIARSTTCTIAPDASVYGFEVFTSAKGKYTLVKMTNPPDGRLYLMKNGQITKKLDGGPLSPTERRVDEIELLAGGDYIVSVDTIEYTMLLIPNPYK